MFVRDEISIRPQAYHRPLLLYVMKVKVKDKEYCSAMTADDHIGVCLSLSLSFGTEP